MHKDVCYSNVAITLHWLTALLILIQLPLGLATHLMEESALDQLFTDLHKPLGMAVLALSLGRLIWRLIAKPPPLPATTPTLERMAAGAVKVLLYALMIVLPVSGWLMTSYVGEHPISFGLFDLPMLPVNQDMASAFAMHDWHQRIAILLTVLAIGHIGAALRHHFILGDDILGRMWPGTAANRSLGVGND